MLQTCYEGHPRISEALHCELTGIPKPGVAELGVVCNGMLNGSWEAFQCLANQLASSLK